VVQRAAEQLQQEYALQNEWSQVRSQISVALADYERAREQFILFKSGIIPQARQTVASMLAGYQVNKVDFLNLIRSQVTLFNHETKYWRALAEAKQSLAKLIAAVGKEGVYE
jgi:cobalt-zinc-cadmium efflux system outer membrane protein